MPRRRGRSTSRMTSSRSPSSRSGGLAPTSAPRSCSAARRACRCSGCGSSAPMDRTSTRVMRLSGWIAFPLGFLTLGIGFLGIIFGRSARRSTTDRRHGGRLRLGRRGERMREIANRGGRKRARERAPSERAPPAKVRPGKPARAAAAARRRRSAARRYLVHGQRAALEGQRRAGVVEAPDALSLGPTSAIAFHATRRGSRPSRAACVRSAAAAIRRRAARSRSPRASR